MIAYICAMPLGLDFVEILLHMFNFALLLIGIRFLLYKPIKKFMAKREEEYKKAEEDKKKAEVEAQIKKKEAQLLMDEAKQKAVKISEEAAAAVEARQKEIIESAHQEAEEILEKARQEIQHEQQKAKEQMIYSVAELAADIASHILEREVNAEDNDKAIATLLEEWKKDA
ncbi:MAG: F0F1 ATP synthase subunit B [Christensenellales bacterium]|jgi:F-type H+-transporting ATPase subunit b|nr:F0F1 ATP synthase subunit B [Clostridiales bacterium]